MEYTTTLSSNKPIVITIGNFDGIHKGHQRLMADLRTMAEVLESTPVLVTFSPHTLMVVRPDIYVSYLTTLEEKLALTKRYGGIAETIVIQFTPTVAAMSAQDFMDSLRERFSIRGLVVGENFSLGHKRMGDISFLTRYGKEHNIEIRAISLEESEQTRISSTRIRALVGEGQVNEANELLGHPVLISGIVVHGDQRGRLLGFPTANLRPDPHKLLPANGVYAVQVTICDQAQEDMSEAGEAKRRGSDAGVGSTVYNGVVNIGIRPTFNGKERIVEAHVLDADLDLYGKQITIEFITRLRSEQRFSGIEALKAQISADIEQARHILGVRRVSN